MRFSLALLGLVIALLSACQSSVKEDSPQRKKGYVTLQGTIQSTRGRVLYVPVTEFLHDINETQLLTEGYVKKDGSFLVQFNIDEPKLLMILGRNAFVKPGETVHLDITVHQFSKDFERVSWKVKAPHAGDYLYYSDTTICSVPVPGSYVPFVPSTAKALMTYKREKQRQWQQRDSVTNHNSALSPAFHKHLALEHKYAYFNALLDKVPLPEDRKQQPLPDEYLSELKAFPWNQDTAVSNLSDYYATLKKYTFDVLSDGTLPQTIELIDRNYQRHNQEYLYYALISKHRNALASIEDETLFRQTRKGLIHAYNQISNPRFTSLLNQVDNGIPAEIPLPDSAKNLLLVDMDGKERTLEQVLGEVKTPYVYVNFWESSCKPCLDDLKFSAHLQNGSLAGQITHLMLASDADEKHQKWKKSHAEGNLPQAYSYRIKGEGYPRIRRAFDIRMQPRYMIMNKNSVVYLNVPPMLRNQRLRNYLVMAEI